MNIPVARNERIEGLKLLLGMNRYHNRTDSKPYMHHRLALQSEASLRIVGALTRASKFALL